MVTNVKRKRKLYKWAVYTYNPNRAEAGENPYCMNIVKAVSVLGAKLAYRKQFYANTRVEIQSVIPYVPGLYV